MKKKISFELKCEYKPSFRSQIAANSVDLDITKKFTHKFDCEVDLESPFNIGLIVGNSGSGKTSLAREMFGKDFDQLEIDLERSVIDQFPKEMPYDECQNLLNGIGLTSIPCWIRPIKTLSNGQQFRARAALALAGNSELIVIDEWTSVVDRTVAKIMSHCVQKVARARKKRVVLMSCHFDVIDWLKPDWVIDCNTQTFTDWGSLRPNGAERERLDFSIREVSRKSWAYFSKYHYLSEKLPGGLQFFYGLYHGRDLIGFGVWSNYVPIRKGKKPMFHSNRVVLHPDYVGLGLGIKFVNECAKLMRIRFKNIVDLRATFSSIPLLRARMKDKTNWRLVKVDVRNGQYKNIGNGTQMRESGFRENVKLFSFRYIGP